MASMNRVVLCGHSGGEAETRFTKSGKAVTNFSLATNDGWGDKEETNWHKVTCWDKTAEYIGEHLTKGASVLVEGRIKYRKHEDKYYTDIIADRVQLLKGSSSSGSQGASDGRPDFEDDDIKF